MNKQDELNRLYKDRDDLERIIEWYGDKTASNMLQNIEQKIKYWEGRK